MGRLRLKCSARTCARRASSRRTRTAKPLVCVGRTSLLLPSCPTAAKPAGGPGTDAAAAAKKAREGEEDRRAAEARAETAKRLGWWLLSINAALTRLHPML